MGVALWPHSWPRVMILICLISLSWECFINNIIAIALAVHRKILKWYTHTCIRFVKLLPMGGVRFISLGSMIWTTLKFHIYIYIWCYIRNSKSSQQEDFWIFAKFSSFFSHVAPPGDQAPSVEHFPASVIQGFFHSQFGQKCFSYSLEMSKMWKDKEGCRTDDISMKKVHHGPSVQMD